MKIIDFVPQEWQKPITLARFYERQPTNVLKAVLVGFERHFDAAHAGEPGHLPIPWLSERIQIISSILTQRAADNHT